MPTIGLILERNARRVPDRAAPRLRFSSISCAKPTPTSASTRRGDARRVSSDR